MTFDEILERLSNLDNAAEEIPLEVWEQTATDLEQKVDAIKVVLDRLALEATRLEEAAEEFKGAARAITRNADRLADRVRWTMEAREVDKLPGKLYRLRLQASAPSVVTDREATEMDISIWGEDLVRKKTTWSWDKKALLEKLKEGIQVPWAHIKTSKHIRFDVKKG